MKKLISFLVIATILASPTFAQTGMEIMQEKERRHESQSEYSRSKMTLTDKKGNSRERIMHNWAMKQPDGTSRTLLKFSAPTDIKNVGLLTWEQPGEKEDDQWLSLPATKQVKRITGGSKKNLFMGTDLAYEDMRSENLDVHTYKVIGEESVGGNACWKVEASPSTVKEKKESGYGKRVLWIRQDNYLTAKTDFYNRAGKLIKQATYDMPVQVKGQLWRMRRTQMKRLQTGTTTTTQMTKLKLDEGVDKSLLTQQGLKRPITEN